MGINKPLGVLGRAGHRMRRRREPAVSLWWWVLFEGLCQFAKILLLFDLRPLRVRDLGNAITVLLERILVDQTP